MKKAPYCQADYDPWLASIVDSTKEHIISKEDDRVFLCVGFPGTGKSNLFLHILERYLGDRASVDLIGLNKTSIAAALKAAKDMDLPRALFIDEANISKRDSASQFNKSMIDLYLAIRGLRILHLWATPSLDFLDKHFIFERITGVFFCCSKEAGARVYFYFTKESILKILEKYDNLTLPLLYRVRKKYSHYRGWFKPYTGFMLQDYLKKKESRMDEKVEDFFEKWAKPQDKETITQKDIRHFLGCSDRTVLTYLRILEEQGVVVEGLNKFTKPNGRIHYKRTIMDDLAKLSIEGIKKKKSTLVQYQGGDA